MIRRHWKFLTVMFVVLVVSLSIVGSVSQPTLPKPNVVTHTETETVIKHEIKRVQILSAACKEYMKAANQVATDDVNLSNLADQLNTALTDAREGVVMHDIDRINKAQEQIISLQNKTSQARSNILNTRDYMKVVRPKCTEGS